MVQDALLVLSDAQAETTAAAHDSTNVLDFQQATPDFGAGTQKFFNVVVNTAFTSAGSATLSVSLQESADASTYSAIATTAAIAVASLTAGKVLMTIPLPPDHERYYKLVYTIGTADMTAGKLDAWVGLDQPRDP